MEMTGIGEAAQFMEVGIRGIDMALRLTGSFAGWTVEKAIQLLKFVIARLMKILRRTLWNTVIRINFPMLF